MFYKKRCVKFKGIYIIIIYILFYINFESFCKNHVNVNHVILTILTCFQKNIYTFIILYIF